MIHRWMPHPNAIKTFRFTGTGNMGNVQDRNDPYRAWLPDTFVWVYLKGLFISGSSSAELTIRLQHRDKAGWTEGHDTLPDSDGTYDFHEKVFSAIGTGGTAFLDYRVPTDEYPRYVYQKGDMLIPVWTNPNTQIWSLEFGLASAEVN